MTDRAILFGGAMVRALLRDADPKTETRRVSKAPHSGGRKRKVVGVNPEGLPIWHSGGGRGFNAVRLEVGQHKHGVVGDRLWVREAWRPWERPEDGVDGIIYRADDAFRPIENTREAAEAWVDVWDRPAWRHRRKAWRRPIHMPRWACRIVLEIIAIRTERLHDITEAGAKAEGVMQCEPRDEFNMAGGTYRCGFEQLWNDINALRGHPWSTNPFVDVITFRRIEP